MVDSNLYIEGALGDYIDALSARKIAPGGGSASALAGAIGAALNLMVINFTLDRDGSGDKEFVKIRSNQELSLSELKLLIDEDCRVFRTLMKSLSSGRNEQKAYLDAAVVPLRICRECYASMEISSLLMKSGNMNLVTDIGGAARILRGAFFSSKLNIDINMGEIQDRKFVKSVTEEVEALANNINHIETAIRVSVKEKMKEKGRADD